MPEEENKEKKEDDKIVFRVDMHCEGCKDKVRKALSGIPGLEKIDFDMKEQKVNLKGKVDIRKVYEILRKKCGKRTLLLHPTELKNEEDKPKVEEKKPEEPPETTVVIKVKMHCGACGKQIKKRLLKMAGVSDVNVDMGNDTVTVKGKNIDANKICDRVKRCGKNCEIVPPPAEEKKEEKAGEEKKEEKPTEEKKEEKAEEKKEEKPAEENKEEEKKEEEKKEEEKKEGAAEEKKDEKSEEKKEDKKEEKKEDESSEVKKYEYIPYRSMPEYMYPPQLFSDENPNACSVM